jgi:hypothetical protein
MKPAVKTRQAWKPKPWLIIGCGVHVMQTEKPQSVQYQGHVVQQQGDRILVQWFSWIMGEPNYATWHTFDEITQNKWRFFENIECMNSYFEAFHAAYRGDK